MKNSYRADRAPRVRSRHEECGPVSKTPARSASYPIRAVSKLTGIGIDTLRAWERRHGAVTPIRDDRGRMYTDADIARLRLLRGAVEHGHSIGRLAGLTDAELRHLAATASASAVSEVAPTRRKPIDSAALTAALQIYDATAIDQQISRLASVLPPLELLRDVLMPVLAQVGDDWHRGPARMAHEHLMSATMRNILGSFLRLYARPEASPRLLFATLAGERHEIGALGAAMLAASSGLGVAYLGPDLPAREIVESVRPARAQVLVLGLTATSAGKGKERELRTIVRDLPKQVELWAGGRGAARHASLITSRGLLLRDYAAYQQELIRIGGRAA
jgi:DNA-binding transcriptional MerR regulator